MIKWDHMRGGITKSPATTTFELTVSHQGHVVGQTVVVANWRLERNPGLFRRTLDLMVRDIGARL